MKYFLRIVIIICIVFTSIKVSGQGWTVNPAAYSNNGTVSAIIFHGSSEVTSGTIGAFVGGTCRGIVEPLFFGATGKWVFILTCYSNVSSGETLTFRYYDPADGTIYNINETVEFVDPLIAGDAMNPLQFHTVPIIYNVTGGGSYCETGLPVGLDDSEIGVTYTLLKNGVAQVPTITGTGSVISFGNQLAGTYTVTGNNPGVTISMTGSAVIVENPSGAAGVTITAVPSGAICTGTSVTFTAIPTNGGTTPTYIWMKGGIPIPGETNSTYTSATLANNEVITVKMTSSAICATGSPVTSAGTTMTVNPILPASVSIAALPSGAICAGTSVTFTATPTNGGSSPVYQWKLNGSNVGTNSPSFTSTTLANSNIVTVEMTSDAVCATGSPTTSGDITMIVNTLPTVTTASVTPASICGSGTVTLSATASSGTIKWYSASTGGTEIMVPNPTISSTTTYYAEAISSQNCVSAARTPVTATVKAIPAAPTGTAAQSFCSIALPKVSNIAITATGTVIWYSAATAGSVVASTTDLVNGATYWASQTISGCESDTRLGIAVTVSDPAAPTGTAAQSFCSIALPKVSNIAITATGTVIWYSAATGGSVVASTTDLVSGTTYWASQTISGCESDTRFGITVTVSDPAAPTGTAAQTFCSATSPTVANLTASGASIKWYLASSGGAALSASTALSNGHYFASQTVSGCESDSRFDVTVTINPTPSVLDQTTSMVTGTSFTVTPNGVPTGTTYTWPAPSYTGGVSGGTALSSGQSNISGSLTIPTGTGTAIYTVTPATSFCTGSTFLVTVTVSSTCIPVTIGTQPVNTSMCTTSGNASFTVVPGGTAPFTYQWEYNNSGTWINVANGTPASASYSNSTTATLNVSGITSAGSPQYRCIVTNCSSATSATSNVVVLTINETPAAPVLGTRTQPTCAIATGSVILNGLPAGNWIINPGSITGSSASTTISGLATGSYTYNVRNAIGCISLSSASIVINAQPTAPTAPVASVTIQPTCAVSTGTILVTSPVSGSGYEYSSGGAYQAGNTFTGLVAGNYNVTVRRLSDNTCISPVTALTVNIQPAAPSAPVAIVTQPTCSISTGTISVTTPAAGSGYEYSAGGSYQAGATFSSLVPGNYNVKVRRISDNTCISPTTALVINAQPTAPTAPVASVTAQPTCAVSTGTISVSSPAAGSGYEYSAGGIYQAGTALTGLAAGNYNVTIRRTSDNTCISPVTPLTINSQPPTPNILDQTTSILSGGTFTVTVGGVPLGTTYKWTTPSYTGGVYGGSSQTSPQLNITGTLNIPSGTGTAVYVVTPTSGSCIGATFTVTVTVTSLCVPVTAGTQPINTEMCATTGNSTFNVVAAGTGPFTYQWQYFNGSTWNNVTNGLPAGASYSNSTSASLSVSGTTSSGNYQYRCYLTNCSGTTNSTSNSATLTVNALPATPSIGTITQPTCALPTGTVVLNGLPAGIWTINPGAITGSTTSTSITGLLPATYTFTVTNSTGCTSVTSSNVVILPEPGKPNAPVAGTTTQPTCSLATGSVVLNGLPAGIWTINPGSISGSGTSRTISALATGTYNYAVTNSIGCTSVLSSNIVINSQPITPVVVITNPVAVCSPSTVNLTASSVTSGSTTGLTYTYWTNSSATTAYPTPAAATTGTYYIKGTTGSGCFDIKPVIATVNPLPAANAGTGGSECDLDFVFRAVPDIGTGKWSMTSGPGAATATFVPDENTATATVTVSAYGTYTFTWTEVSNGCSNNSTVTVIFNQQPVANAGAGGNNCGTGFNLSAVQSVGSGTWTKTSGPGTVIFTPNANTPGARATVSLYGNYTFTWTEINGSCSNNSSVNVTYLQVPVANAGIDGTVCNLEYVLNATLWSVTGTGTWTKLSGPGSAVFGPDATKPGAKVKVDQVGTYYFTWTEFNGTCQASDIVRVIFRSLPAVSAGKDTTICISDNIQLQGTGTGSFSWEPAVMIIDPKIKNPVAVPLSSTYFIVTLTDQYGCVNKDTVLIGVADIPVANAGPDLVFEYLFGTTLTALEPGPGEIGTWSIVDGSGVFENASSAVSAVSGLSLGENILLWSVTNGVCPASNDYLSIIVKDLIIPTLITPNMDGKNDYFVLRGIETLGKTELVIFDRRGAQVYKNTNYDNSWNGVDSNERPLLDDTYYFVIKSESGKAFSGYIVVRR